MFSCYNLHTGSSSVNIQVVLSVCAASNAKMLRKIAVATITLTGAGWLLVVIGFGIACDNDELFVPLPMPPKLIHVPVQGDLTNPNAYLYWVVCITGMFVITAAFLHTCLWQPFRSFFGAITSFLAVVFITGLGMILNWNGSVIRNPDHFSLPPSFSLQFAGALTAAIFWTLTMILWHFYDSEKLKMIPAGTPREVARKIAVPFILVTAIGWLLVVVGFAIAINKDHYDKDSPNAYPFWVVSVSGSVTVILALIHAAVKTYPHSSRLGAILSVLSVVFLTGLGMIMYNSGVNYRFLDSLGLTDSIPDSSKLEFAGSIIATASWTAVLILWHFYDYKAKTSRENYGPLGQH